MALDWTGDWGRRHVELVKRAVIIEWIRSYTMVSYLIPISPLCYLTLIDMYTLLSFSPRNITFQ